MMILVPAREVRLIDSINLLISVVFTVNLPIPFACIVSVHLLCVNCLLGWYFRGLGQKCLSYTCWIIMYL